MSIEKGLMGQGEEVINGQDEKMVDIDKLIEKTQNNLEVERSMSQNDGERAVQNLASLYNLVDNYLESIKKGDVSLEELKSRRDALSAQMMAQKKDIMANIKDDKLQRELISRVHNSYDYLTYKAIGFITE